MPFLLVPPLLVSQSGLSDPLTITEPTLPSKPLMPIIPPPKLTLDHHTNLLLNSPSLSQTATPLMMRRPSLPSVVTTLSQENTVKLVPAPTKELLLLDSPLMMMIFS